MLPSAFISQMQELLGAAEADNFIRTLSQTVPPVSIRTNPLKPAPSLPAGEEGRVPWCQAGIYLKERPRFTYDPLFHAGCYYVQEAASMYVEQAYRRIAAEGIPHRVLDLCAAPGGKSTLWRSLLPEGSLLVANEPVRQRAQILAENLTKWGHPDVVVTSAYPEEFALLGSCFDVIAADVPCSGEGMFRKDETAVAEWSPEAVQMCAARQWDIIKAVWPALREGGFLVYSTCTYNRLENEDNVLRICRELGAEPVSLPAVPEWGVSGDVTGHGLPVSRFFPHLTRGEGLFLALLRKTSSAPVMKERKMKRGGSDSRQAKPRGGASVSRWLGNDSAFRLFRSDEEHLVAVRETLFSDVTRISAAVRTLTSGIMLAGERGRKVVPQHSLALSSELRADAFPRAELSAVQALSYLRREALTLPPAVPRGYVVVTFGGLPLGFVNNLGSRANNLYPAEWRIRN